MKSLWNMLWPLLLIVFSNCLYNISTKSVPAQANTFGTLTIAYTVGAILSGIVFTVSVGPAKLGAEIQKCKWSAVLLGVCIIGLEAGYVFLYRAGWKVSSGSVTSNICLAVALLFIGYFLYKEHISVRQLIGVAVCGAGLFLITK